MYAGHLAIGVALKARYPSVPALPIMIGVGFVIPPLLTAVKSRGLGRLRLHGWWYAANG